MATNTKLLPCPFCDGEAVRRHEQGSWGYYPGKHWVECAKCGGRTGAIRSDDEEKAALVVMAWNLRGQTK